MKTIIADIETDNLLLDLTTMWVGSTYCVETKESKVFYSAVDMVNYINKADLVVGHNWIGFDHYALEKLTGLKLTTKILDTMIFAKLVYYDKDKSWSHSLDAYGERLGEKKGSYSDWSRYTPEMETYCIQDVKVTYKLYVHLLKVGKWLPKEAIELEQDVQHIITRQYMTGWEFDEKKAQQLHIELEGEKEEALSYLLSKFTPKFLKKGKEKTPAKPFTRLGITTAGTHQPIELKEFNPGSGAHIVHWVELELGKQKWPLTKKGNPKTDRETLEDMFSKEAFIQPLLHYLEVNKLLSQLATGDMAWLKHIRDGRIHGSMDILGANTGRATHSNPNLGQVPSSTAYKGKEARELFISKKGYSNVGCDLSGVELRCLAHYLTPYDKGRYSSIILKPCSCGEKVKLTKQKEKVNKKDMYLCGSCNTIFEGSDIHIANQEAAGLPTRDQAKTFIYSVVYGGGDAKVGEIIHRGAREGKQLKAKFMNGTPGFKELGAKVKETSKKNKYLRGISGRRIHIRSLHSALNALLQSLGGYISKYWMVEVDKRIQEKGLDCYQIGWIHDELQFECLDKDTGELSRILEEASIKIGLDIGIRMAIHSEAAVGSSWYEVH